MKSGSPYLLLKSSIFASSFLRPSLKLFSVLSTIAFNTLSIFDAILAIFIQLPVGVLALGLDTSHSARLFQRTQDRHRTQVAGLQVQVLILTYCYFRERFLQLLTGGFPVMHGRNHSESYFFKRNQSSDNRSHGFGARFPLKKLSASDFSYERKSAFLSPY